MNVALLPVLLGLAYLDRSLGWAAAVPNLHVLLHALWRIDLGLLVFNMLPIYPLDGGQILRSLLWFVLGRARSLVVATVLGFFGIAAFIVLAVWIHSVWFAALAVFMLMNCWGGLQHARALSRFAKLPRRDGFACPVCKTAPPIGDFWKCGKCGQPFDTFSTHAVCPYCATQFGVTRCLDCGEVRPMNEWVVPVVSVSSTFSSSTR